MSTCARLDTLFVLYSVQSEMTKTEEELQRMVQERIRKSEDITASVELSKVCVLTFANMASVAGLFA